MKWLPLLNLLLCACVNDLVSKCHDNTDCTGTKQCNLATSKCETGDVQVADSNVKDAVALNGRMYTSHPGACASATGAQEDKGEVKWVDTTVSSFPAPLPTSLWKGTPTVTHLVASQDHILAQFGDCAADGRNYMPLAADGAAGEDLGTVVGDLDDHAVLLGNVAYLLEKGVNYGRVLAVPLTGFLKAKDAPAILCKSVVTTPPSVHIEAFVLNDTRIYWTDGHTISVSQRAPTPDCPSNQNDTPMEGSGNGFISMLGLHGDHLVWFDGNQVRDRMLDQDGITTGPTTTGAWTGSKVGALWVDSDGIYWTDTSNPARLLFRSFAAAGDAAPVVLATDVATDTHISISAGRIVFIQASPERAAVARLLPKR